MSDIKSIVSILSTLYKLSPQLQSLLLDRLNEPGVLEEINSRTLSPEDLLIQMNVNGLIYTTVLSPLAIKSAINDPSSLMRLKQSIQSHPNVWLQWEKMKENVIHLQKLHFKSKEKKRIQERLFLQSTSTEIKTFVQSNTILTLEHTYFISIPLFECNVSLTQHIEQAAESYFRPLLQEMGRIVVDDIEVEDKENGIHHGCTMNFTYVEPQNTTPSQKKIISYYIKTHENSSMKTSDEQIAPVEPKELFVYKVLEYTGYGPKVHFFYNANEKDSDQFYIATQAAGFTKSHLENKIFEEYAKLQSEYDKHFSNEDYEPDRSSIIAIDILTRVLRLKDTLTNNENFGRIKVNGRPNGKWKLLDFKFIESSTYEEPNIAHFFEFREEHRAYQNPKTFLGSLFKDKSYITKRFNLTRKMLTELKNGRTKQDGSKKPGFFEAVVLAHDYVKSYIAHHSQYMGIVNVSDTLEDLENYYKAVILNFRHLMNDLSGLSCYRSINISPTSEKKSPSAAITRSLPSSCP